MSFEYAKQPLGIGQQLDQMIKLCKNSYKSVFNLVLTLVVLGGVYGAFMPTGAPDFEGSSTAGLALAGSGVVYGLAVIVVYAAMILKMNADATGKEIALGDAVNGALAKFPMLIAGSILYVLVILLGYLLLIIPGIIVSVSLMLTIVLICAEDLNAFNALKRSHNLIWGNWWRTLILVSVISIIFSVLLMLLTLGITVVAPFLISGEDMSQALVVANIVSSALGGFIQPVFVAMLLVIYNDLLHRREGEDLDAEIEAL